MDWRGGRGGCWRNCGSLGTDGAAQEVQPEFWKPFAKDVLAGHLPVVWEERDTRLYEIPRARRTMAHSVPGMIRLGA